MPKVRLFSISLRYELLTVVSVIGVGCCNGVVEKTGERQKRGPALKGANYTRASTICLSFIPSGWALALLRQEKPMGEALLVAPLHENATLWAAMAMGPMATDAPERLAQQRLDENERHSLFCWGLG